MGRTWVKVNGQREFTQVVFASEGTEPILGADLVVTALADAKRTAAAIDRYLREKKSAAA